MMMKCIPPTATTGHKTNGTNGTASNTAPEKGGKDHKGTRRTRNKAGYISEIPDRLPVITSSIFQNALTFNKNGNAYLQPLKSDGTDQIQYEGGNLLLDGYPATLTELDPLCIKGNENIANFNLILLRTLYGIFLTEALESLSECRGKRISIYLPDFMRKTGRNFGIKEADYDGFVNAIKQFNSVVGIINNGMTSSDILPVLVTEDDEDKENRDKNTISLTSPYIARLARDIYVSGIRKKENGELMLKKNGRPQMLPTYSYLIDISIAKERNRKAVEIVFIVVTLIEQTGNNTPHIRAKTIIGRNPLLQKSMEGQTTGNKNTLLKRAFVKAWQLLRGKTFLAETYKNIHLPDPENPTVIPKVSTLNMVFSFPHEGKNKNS